MDADDLNVVQPSLYGKRNLYGFVFIGDVESEGSLGLPFPVDSDLVVVYRLRHTVCRLDCKYAVSTCKVDAILYEVVFEHLLQCGRGIGFIVLGWAVDENALEAKTVALCSLIHGSNLRIERDL